MTRSRLRLLDLFCGGGGAAKGYVDAGFDVTGVDIVFQRHYPFRFIQCDALEYVAKHGHEYDSIHASPPCQAYSATRYIPNRRDIARVDLVAQTRVALEATGRLWVIENVVGSPLRSPLLLCGTMFGLLVYRHRLFESPLLLFGMAHPVHRVRIKSGRLAHYQGQPGRMVTVAGHMFSARAAATAMGIDWMTRDELAQAIPPAYTRLIGTQLLRALAPTRNEVSA